MIKVACMIYNKDGSVYGTYVVDGMDNAIKSCLEILKRTECREARLVGNKTVLLSKKDDKIVKSYIVSGRGVHLRLMSLLREVYISLGLDKVTPDFKPIVYTIYDSSEGIVVTDLKTWPPKGGIAFDELDGSGCSKEYLMKFVNEFNRLEGVRVDTISFNTACLTGGVYSGYISYMESSSADGCVIVKVDM